MDSSTNSVVDPRFMQGRALLDEVGRSVWGGGREGESWRGDRVKKGALSDRVVDHASDVYIDDCLPNIFKGLVDDAIDFWAEILRLAGEDEAMDELNLKLAPVYYEYGNALLLKTEDVC